MNAPANPAPSAADNNGEDYRQPDHREYPETRTDVTNTTPAPTPRTRTIQIGALCDPLSKQLHGIISEKDADMLDRDNEAITRCYLMGYMPDSMTAKARKRLMDKCQKAVSAHSSKKGTQ